MKKLLFFAAVAAILIQTGYYYASYAQSKRAVVELNPATLNPGGDAGDKADWVRYRLVTVNGQTGDYILASGHGSTAGYIGEINEIVDEELGPVFEELGIESCDDIPTTGTGSATLTDDGESFTLTATFSTGTVTIPSFYENNGETLDKRIELSEEGDTYLVVELDCDDDISTAYTIFPATDDNTRAREVYFQKVAATGETRVDMHMVESTNSEKMAFRFHYDGSVAKIWVVRAYNNTSGSGETIVINPATGVFHAIFLDGGLNTSHADDWETSLTNNDATEMCIDMGTNTALTVATDCTGATPALDATDPADNTIHGNLAFTIDAIDGMVAPTP